MALYVMHNALYLPMHECEGEQGWSKGRRSEGRRGAGKCSASTKEWQRGQHCGSVSGPCGALRSSYLTCTAVLETAPRRAPAPSMSDARPVGPTIGRGDSGPPPSAPAAAIPEAEGVGGSVCSAGTPKD